MYWWLLQLQVVVNLWSGKVSRLFMPESFYTSAARLLHVSLFYDQASDKKNEFVRCNVFDLPFMSTVFTRKMFCRPHIIIVQLKNANVNLSKI